jgi:D-apiose dehydrogenase
MQELRGALIGCGFFAVNHMHGWRDAKGASIVAICDQNAGRLDAIGEQFNIAACYDDARKMLEEVRPDFVDIATTVSSHLAACAKAQVPLMVHENFRWQSAMLKVKQVLQSGTIGKPFWGRVSFRSAYNVFSGQPYLAEGERFIVEDLGIHALDIARFLFGDVHSLSARTARVNSNIKGEDVATVLLDHENGVTSVVDCSYATKLETEAFPETLIEIDGTEGTIRLAQGYKLTVTNADGSSQQDISPTVLSWASKPWHNIQESVALIEQHWIDCLKSGTEPATSGRDNLQTLALVEATYESASTKQTVKISELLA